jgi:homoserine kinase
VGAVRITCPATAANLGPGYDVLGLALDLRANFEVTPADAFDCVATGPRAEGLPRGADNLVVRAYQETRAALGEPAAPGLRVRAELVAPPGSGLGSSSTAVAAGILAAEAHAGRILDQAAKWDLAVRLEGHPDNVIPCLEGGLCAVVQGPGGLVVQRAVPPGPPALVVLVPEALELSTPLMRSALPDHVPFADAVRTVGCASSLVFALLRGDHDALRVALDDRLHQPYRGAHIPGWEAAREAALAAGALGAVISGSGPSLLGLAPDRSTAQAVGAAMAAAWAEAGVVARVHQVSLAAEGARVEAGGA